MLSSCVKFSADRQTDGRTPVKQYALNLSMRGGGGHETDSFQDIGVSQTQLVAKCYQKLYSYLSLKNEFVSLTFVPNKPLFLRALKKTLREKA